MTASRRLFGNLIRAAIGVAALWLIWMVWRPVYFTLSEDVVQVVDETELAVLTTGTEFILQGTVEPVAPSGNQWQGRFAFVHRERKDFAGGPSKDQRVVDVENQRPALRFIWSGGIFVLSADTYGLEFAPHVKRRFWPRKWLGTKRVDDWHQTSTGFRAGESACAYGRVNGGGHPQIEELMQWPLRDVVTRIGSDNRFRHWLTIGFKLFLSLICVACAMPRGKAEN